MFFRSALGFIRPMIFWFVVFVRARSCCLSLGQKSTSSVISQCNFGSIFRKADRKALRIFLDAFDGDSVMTFS
jgi:hypothetical protein